MMKRWALPFVVLFLLLVCVAERSYAQLPPRSFLQLQLGMPAGDVFRVLNKPDNSLEKIPLINNKRILIDTLMLDSCSVKMRRSFGFDATNILTVVGFTYKGSPEDVDSKKECVLNWVKKELGNPRQTEVKDDVTIYKWNFQDGANLSLESKGYNEKDHFILMYYYK